MRTSASAKIRTSNGNAIDRLLGVVPTSDRETFDGHVAAALAMMTLRRKNRGIEIKCCSGRRHCSDDGAVLYAILHFTWPFEEKRRAFCNSEEIDVA